jgi:hypothetical protein
MAPDFLIERRRDAIHRQIVVGRPDTACGEDVIVQTGKQTNFAGNQIKLIGDNRYLLQVDAKGAQLAGQEQGVFILCLSRQDFIPDDDDSRRFGHVFFTITKADGLHHIESSREPLQTGRKFVRIATDSDADMIGHFEEAARYDRGFVFLTQQ